MSKWKLYWVASDGLEDCFVVAKNSKRAARIEKDMNGFEYGDIVVTRIMDVPDKYEEIVNKKLRKRSRHNHCNEQLDGNNLMAWPWYAEEWLLKELGAKYRVLEGETQILINDIVITPDSIYSVGVRAMKEISELTGEHFINIANVSYEGMREAIDKMLGICLTTIHGIEALATDSFIFAVGNKKYDEYTIKEAVELWKKRFTFGQLIQLIQERYEIDETIYDSLRLFLIQRNKIVHGLTKDERYDIDTVWGQKEIIGYIALFLRNAWLVEEIF